MYLGTMADKYPDRQALVLGDGEIVLSYADLDARSNQVAHALRYLGLRPGDGIVVMLDNCEQFFEAWWAAMRSGLYFTAINWHLTAPEVEYLVTDSNARAVIYSGRLSQVVDSAVATSNPAALLSVGDTSISRAVDYTEIRNSQPDTRLPDETEGSPMFYSSGTTGRPKGIKRRLSGLPPWEKRSRMVWTAERYHLTDGCRYLSPGPLYHGAPSLWSSAVHTVGGTAVVMRRFDPEQALMLIDHQEITDSQWVPTMLHRMVRLPQELRDRYDVSSMRHAWTAAAPISIDLKRKMIDWWGSCMFEYYASSEGGGTTISADDWLRHPGSVGRHYAGDKIYILDSITHDELPPGQEGVIYFPIKPSADFEYHNDPVKTAEAHHGSLFTAGDMGYVDHEGYLYLTDRQSNMIISGGVNLYPREIEDAISSHPAVFDVAVIGVPDEDLGEKAHAVIQPVDQSSDPDTLIADVRSYLGTRLARQKIPRSFEVAAQLPRDENGKLYKRRLREASEPADHRGTA
jgi:fatty-acyl-CoA synthase